MAMPDPPDPSRCAAPYKPFVRLPVHHAGYSEIMEFLATLPRAGDFGLAVPPARHRDYWADSAYLHHDFGWTHARLYEMADALLREHGVRVRIIHHKHQRRDRLYLAIADEHWDIAVLIAQEYWSSIGSIRAPRAPHPGDPK